MNKETVVIYGSTGYLGSYFKKLYPDAITPTGIDIADMLGRPTDIICHGYSASICSPTIVINCAGRTGRPNVDWCEDNKAATMHSNTIGALVLAEWCLKNGVYFVNVGSGCIYDGYAKDFSELDTPNFFGSFYSKTKAATDIVLDALPVLNLRLRMPFDGTLNPRNLIMKLRGYSRVLTARNSMTYIPDFMFAADHLIGTRQIGTFNIVNPEPISPYDLMKAFKNAVDPTHCCEPLDISELPDVARAARSNCILSGEKLKSLGIPMTDTDVAVAAAFRGVNRTWYGGRLRGREESNEEKKEI